MQTRDGGADEATCIMRVLTYPFQYLIRKADQISVLFKRFEHFNE